MRAIVKCVIQREVYGKRQRGRPKCHMTPCSCNIAKLFGENVEEIMRGNWCDRAALIVIPDETAEE